MRTVALIACRMGSSRLPGKSIAPILGRPMIERMVERVARSQFIDRVVIATTELPVDQPLADLASRLGIGCFRGSPDDVLKRMFDAVQTTDADVVVELLGDNPLVHSALIDDVIELYRAGGYEYAASVTTEYRGAPEGMAKFPLGVRVQVFSPQTLERCHRAAVDLYYRENSTAYIADNPNQFRIGYLEAAGRWAPLHRPQVNFAVNLQKNLDLVREIFGRCHPRNPDFTLVDVMQTFDADSRLQALARS